MRSALGTFNLEDSPEAVIATAEDGTVLFWSSGAESLFGYGRLEAVGRRIEDLVVPADLALEESEHRARALEKGTAVYESVRRRKDGSPVFVSISSRERAADGGAPRCVLSSTSDITHLRVARDAKLVETRFSELLESMPDGIVIVNLTGRIVYCNQQAEALFGYSPRELKGEAIEALLPHRFRSGHVAYRSGYFDHPRARAMGVGLDLYGLRKDGTEFPIEISLSPLRTEEGTLAVSAIRDTSERKRIERALQEKNVELERANRAKDRFLATMSHELRTPLNAIIGFTGTLLMKLPGPLNAEQEKQLETVLTGGRHLLSLINDLLDLAKIEAGKVELHLEPTICQEVVKEVAAALQPQAAAKGLSFATRFPPANVVIQTDRRALSQILLNLANNAIKFTSRGGVVVRIERVASGRGPVVRFAVEDSGIGIAARDQERLFEAFSQVAGPGSREGTGLGLHLSRKLGELLGGRVSLTSELGKGSVFTLELEDR